MDMANPEVVTAPPHTQLQNERCLWPRIGKASALLGIGIAGALYSAANIETETIVAGHRVETTLTTDGFATFDTGMPGALASPVDIPAGFGAHLNIKEMPADLTVGSDPAELTARELTYYAQSLTNLESDLQNTAETMAKRSLLYGLGAMAVAASLYKLPGREARQMMYEQRFQPVMQRMSPSLMAVCMLGIGLPPDTAVAAERITSAPDGFVPVSMAFEGTPLEGTYVKGRWMQLAVNTAGVEILSYINKNEEFYKTADDNLRIALEESLTYRPTEQSITALFYTDYHCNAGMSRLLQTTAEKYEVSLALDGGDTTASGTEYEQFCIRPLAKALRGVPKIVSLGNHDSSVTGEQMRAAGFKVLNDRPVTLKGVTILGDSDPRRSEFGIDTYQIGDETVDDVGKRLADTACQSERSVDIVLIHDQDAALETLRRGCAKFALSGHMHKESIDDIEDENGVQRLSIAGGSAGGAGRDMATLGPLHDDAWLTVLKIDKSTHQLLGHQTITIRPDASVIVGPRSHRLTPTQSRSYGD